MLPQPPSELATTLNHHGGGVHHAVGGNVRATRTDSANGRCESTMRTDDANARPVAGCASLGRSGAGALGGPGPHGLVERDLAKADRGGRDLHALVVGDVLQRL